MTPNEILVKFLKAKTLLLFRLTRVRLCNAKDYAEVMTWSEEQCQRAFEGLQKWVEGCRIDCYLCPFCAVSKRSCRKDCGYAKRHGECNFYRDDNPYGRITPPGKPSISKAEGMRELVEETLKNAEPHS